MFRDLYQESGKSASSSLAEVFLLLDTVDGDRDKQLSKHVADVRSKYQKQDLRSRARPGFGWFWIMSSVNRKPESVAASKTTRTSEVCS